MRVGFLVAALCFTAVSFDHHRPIAAAELDETRQHRSQARAPLSWDNITAKSGYLSGVKPEHSISRRMSCVELAPGQCVELFVPAHELIRVVSCGSGKLADGVQIWTSDGSGMYRKHNAARTADGCSLIAAPDHSSISIAKVCRPKGTSGSVCVAVFTSRRETPRLLDYYQCPLQRCGNLVEIKDNRGSDARQYWMLPGGQSKALQISGPKRLRIETRLKYGLDIPQRQPYWLQVYLDGQLHRVLSFTTQPNSDHRVFVDGCERLVGRREFAYLDLDCGDRTVEIRSTHDAYVSVNAIGLELCRPNLNRSFDFPHWENVQKALSIWDARESRQPIGITEDSSLPGDSFLQHAPGQWNGLDAPVVDDAEIHSFSDGMLETESVSTGDPIWDPYLNQQRISHLAQNNRIPHGGLRAYMWMRAIAARHYGDADFGDEISVAELASRTREYTLYKDLLPSEMGETRDVRSIAFSPQRIRSPQQPATEVIVGEQHLPSAVAAIPSATVCRLSQTDAARLNYRVPESLGASMIRVVVDQSHLRQNACLMVQFDDSQPIQMAVNPGDPLKPDCFSPGRTAAALSCLSNVHGRYDSGTAGGPFAICSTPRPMTRVATAELIKPAHVKTIQIWLANCATQTAYVGLQYLDGRTHALPETAFRALNAIVTAEGDGSPLGRFAQQEINNDSLPIERLLRTNYESFVSTIQPSSELNESTDIWGPELLSEIKHDAKRFETEGLWPEAIEQWTKIIRHSAGPQRLEAILARADALQAAGETVLAKREWRGWLRYSHDPVLQAQAVDRLLDAAGDNQRLREMILSFAAIEAKDNLFTLQLAHQFMQNGRHRFALLVLSSMKANEHNQDILLRCSFQIQWWTLFDQTVARLHDPAAKNLWMGLKELKLGRYDHAYRLLQSGGEEGQRWLDHWQTGDQIFGQLCHANTQTRLSALAKWENWQSNSPGHRTWVEEPLAIRSATQTRMLNLASRAIRFPTHLVQHGQRGTVQLYGPSRVRLEVRPIHHAVAAEPIDDWILISGAGVNGGIGNGGNVNGGIGNGSNDNTVQRIPILQNQPSTTASLEDSPGDLPGQTQTIELDLPPGLNEFHVACESSKFLLRVETLRPEISLPALPWINATTMAAVVKGSFGRHRHTCKIGTGGIGGGDCTDCVRMLCRNRECRSVPLSFDAMPCGCQELHSAQEYFGRLSYDDAKVWENRVVPTEISPAIVGMDEPYRIATERLADTQRSQDEAEKLAAIVQVQRLVETFPDRADLAEILDQMMSATTWEPFRQFDARAGVHSLSVDGWMPSSPKARIVAAMFGDDIATHVLAGSQKLTLLMNNPEPAEIEVVLRRPRLSFSPTGETSVVLEGRSRSQVVSLGDPEKRTVARVTIGAGPRSLQISQANPLVNHYVHVDLNEILPDGSVVPIDHDKVRMQQKVQTYQVATMDEPLKFRVAGPALLRIDRNEDGRRTHQFLSVDEDKSYALVPSVGTESALLRIYQLKTNGTVTPSLRTAPSPPPTPDRWADDVVQVAYDSVDHANDITTLDQLALRSPDLLPLTIKMQDGTDLGLQPLQSQRLGTLAIAGGFRQRDAVEEFNNIANTERFFETQLSRYHYDHWHDRYSANHLIGRVRADGGPTLGLIHEGASSYPLDNCESDDCWGSRADGWSEFQFNYRAYAFGQFDGEPILDSVSETPWSAGVNARLTRRHELTPHLHHMPGVSLFARTLSENENGYASGELDQDVFTQYKSDHRQGLRFSDRLVYQTCLDRRFWISPSLMTNDAEWTPDNVAVQVGTDQLLGPLQFQLAYRMTGFLADNDRRSASLQNVLYLDLVLETWHSKKRRSELAFSMRNDLTNSRSSVGINFVSFVNHSRGYRDFRPASTLFRSIRQERAAKQYSSGR